MRIIPPQRGFIVRVRQTLRLPETVFLNNVFRYWDPLNGSFNELHRFDNTPYYDDFEYCEYCYDRKLFYMPIFYGDKWTSLPAPLYIDFLKQSFASKENLVSYPLRSNSFPSIFSNGELNLVEEFTRNQALIRKLALKIARNKRNDPTRPIKSYVKMSERNVFLKGYYLLKSDDPLNNFELDRKWMSEEERNKDKDFIKWLKTSTKMFVFEEWSSYIIWELLGKTRDLGIAICDLCGNILDIKPRGHRDRRLCKKEESLTCWREQMRLKKKKHRQTS